MTSETYGTTGSLFDGRYVTPVVTLEIEILTSGQDENGAWNLIVE